MAAHKIKKGDKVAVLAGRCRGKTGVVLRALDDRRVLVEGVNLVKKHQRPNPQRNEQGGILERESPIHRSNVALVNPVTGKADRVGFKTLADGKKVRCFKSNGEMADV